VLTKFSKKKRQYLRSLSLTTHKTYHRQKWKYSHKTKIRQSMIRYNISYIKLKNQTIVTRKSNRFSRNISPTIVLFEKWANSNLSLYYHDTNLISNKTRISSTDTKHITDKWKYSHKEKIRQSMIKCKLNKIKRKHYSVTERSAIKHLVYFTFVKITNRIFFL